MRPLLLLALLALPAQAGILKEGSVPTDTSRPRAETTVPAPAEEPGARS